MGTVSACSPISIRIYHRFAMLSTWSPGDRGVRRGVGTTRLPGARVYPPNARYFATLKTLYMPIAACGMPVFSSGKKQAAA